MYFGKLSAVLIKQRSFICTVMEDWLICLIVVPFLALILLLTILWYFKKISCPGSKPGNGPRDSRRSSSSSNIHPAAGAASSKSHSQSSPVATVPLPPASHHLDNEAEFKVGQEQQQQFGKMGGGDDDDTPRQPPYNNSGDGYYNYGGSHQQPPPQQPPPSYDDSRYDQKIPDNRSYLFPVEPSAPSDYGQEKY